jgi:hypothetical protein
VINNTPQTIHFFEGAPPGEKERWFQQCMGQIYNQHAGQNISIRDLNKKAIDFMLQTLNKRLGATERLATEQLVANAPITGPSAINKPMIVSKPITTTALSMNDQFARRQAEYDSMVKKEIPTHNFTENVKDEAILDLNSVVEAYKRNRTEDVGVVIPPPSPSPSQKLNLRSNNELESVSIHVEELPKKGVQWGQNTEHEFDNNHSIIEGRIVNIERGINEIKSQMSEILSILKVIPYPKIP